MEVLDAERAAGNHTIEVVAQQTANYVREEGQTVTEQLISANPDINLIYAHNDEMALGAVAALKAAGLQPGDVKIITIDGTQARSRASSTAGSPASSSPIPASGPSPSRRSTPSTTVRASPQVTIIERQGVHARERRG